MNRLLRNSPLLCAGVVGLALLLPSQPAAAMTAGLAPVATLSLYAQAGAAQRQGVVRALAEIRAQHGGRKLGQHWQGNTLLVPWVDAAGQRMLFEINPENGEWRRTASGGRR